MIKPILVLTLICLIVAGVLSITNSFTAPVIAEGAAQRESDVRKAVLPDADGFEAVDIAGLPPSVTEVYKATNGVGYVFSLSVNGYGGNIIILCAIGEDGKIVHNSVTEQSETQGLGSRVAGAPFQDQFIGKDAGSLSSIDTISGATISSKAYLRAISDAFTAFDTIAGTGK